MKIKRYSALILAGMLTCTAPAAVYAQDVTEIAEEILTENELGSLLEDPDKVTDIILYVKDQIGQQEVSDEDILSVINYAEETFQITLTDEDRQSLLNIIKKVKDMDLDEEKLRKQVNKVYDTLEDLGIEKSDVKNILQKAIDFVENLLD